MFMNINQIINFTHMLCMNKFLLICFSLLVMYVISKATYCEFIGVPVFCNILFLIFIGKITHNCKLPIYILSILLGVIICTTIYAYIYNYLKLKKSSSNTTFRDLLLNIDTYKLVENLYERWKERVKNDIEINKDIYEFSRNDENFEEITKEIKKELDIDIEQNIDDIDIDKVISEKIQEYIKNNSLTIKEKLVDYIETLKTLAEAPNKYNTENYMFSDELASNNLYFLRLMNIKYYFTTYQNYKPSLFYLYTSIDKEILESKFSDIDIVSEIIFKITEKLKYLSDDEKLKNSIINYKCNIMITKKIILEKEKCKGIKHLIPYKKGISFYNKKDNIVTISWKKGLWTKLSKEEFIKLVDNKIILVEENENITLYLKK